MSLPITLAVDAYDRTAPLADGRVNVEGVELNAIQLPVEEIFFRMARNAEFDAAEMSLSSYTLTLQRDRRFVAIPVFPSRAFRHNGIYVHAENGVQGVEDLPGAVVGVPEYQVTAAVWIRGILAEHHHVPVDSVSYRTGGLHAPGRPEKLAIEVPGVDIRPIAPGKTLSEMLLAGEIDALYTPRTPAPYLARHPSIRRLWADPRCEEERYFAQTGIFPIMHTLVIRREIYERNRLAGAVAVQGLRRGQGAGHRASGGHGRTRFDAPLELCRRGGDRAAHGPRLLAVRTRAKPGRAGDVPALYGRAGIAGGGLDGRRPLRLRNLRKLRHLTPSDGRKLTPSVVMVLRWCCPGRGPGRGS